MESDDNINDEKSKHEFDEQEFSTIQDTENKLLELSNNLFNGGIDFVKWTTTISIAVIVWMGSASISQSSKLNLESLLGVSFLFFTVSIILAIAIVYFVLQYRAIQMQSCYNYLNYQNTRNNTEKKDPNNVHPTTLYWLYQHLLSKSKLKYFEDPKNYVLLIIYHMVFLLLGLGSYLTYFLFV
jgi:hypothetical protein